MSKLIRLRMLAFALSSAVLLPLTAMLSTGPAIASGATFFG